MAANGRDSKELTNIMFSYTSNTDELEEENRLLKETVNQLKNDVDRLKTPPLMLCEVRDIMKNNAVIKVPNGNQFFVFISQNCQSIKPGDTVLVDQKNLNIIRRFSTCKKFNVERFIIIEKPTVEWEDIGGLKEQIQEIREVVELPLKKPELFTRVGIHPPKGILLYGPPGTGKTLLAKAVANSTESTFVEVVGSELVQKFIGEGAKLVKEIFNLAREKAPAIVFIDEIDALASRRIDVGTSGEREVQRTFMQLLAEIDGFKTLDNVKVIGCTNRKDLLDPAVVRPGRLDRLISVPLPGKEGIKEIFKIHTSTMNLDKEINLEKIFKSIENFSGADIKSLCTEAGYFAIRNNRYITKEKDFLKAVNKLKNQNEFEKKDYLNMFG
ncbi:proteasome-activating nucleotidase [Candidatus Pacearchaeota archaeon]|nr:proteasome-activating nucleotidase [Candidatus Pacearchaeota archaeon]